MKYEATSSMGLLQPFPCISANLGGFVNGLRNGAIESERDELHFSGGGSINQIQSFYGCEAHPLIVKEIMRIFVKEVVRLHGFPRTIVTN